MEVVAKEEIRPGYIHRFVDCDWNEIEESPKLFSVEAQQPPIFSHEAVDNGGRGVKPNTPFFQELLKGSGVVIGVAVGEDKIRNQARVDSVAAHPLSGVYRRINQNAATVDPDNEAGGVGGGVEAVAASDDGDAVKRRMITTSRGEGQGRFGRRSETQLPELAVLLESVAVEADKMDFDIAYLDVAVVVEDMKLDQIANPQLASRFFRVLFEEGHF